MDKVKKYAISAVNTKKVKAELEKRLFGNEDIFINVSDIMKATGLSRATSQARLHLLLTDEQSKYDYERTSRGYIISRKGAPRTRKLVF